MNRLSRLAHREIRRWLQWRMDRRMAKAMPELSRTRREIEAARRSHKPVKQLVEKQRALMLSALRGGDHVPHG